MGRRLAEFFDHDDGFLLPCVCPSPDPVHITPTYSTPTSRSARPPRCCSTGGTTCCRGRGGVWGTRVREGGGDLCTCMRLWKSWRSKKLVSGATVHLSQCNADPRMMHARCSLVGVRAGDGGGAGHGGDAGGRHGARGKRESRHVDMFDVCHGRGLGFGVGYNRVNILC